MSNRDDGAAPAPAAAADDQPPMATAVPPNQHPIDVRLFLAAIASGMILAFGAGVAFGPTPAFLLEPNQAMYDLEAARADPPAADTGDDANGKIPRAKREPASHAMELGGQVREKHVTVNQEPSYEDFGSDIYSKRNLSVPTDDQTDAPQIEGEEEHQPAGQHLLVDIKNVEADFLDSEERLVAAMVAVVDSAKLTLLSYHCHQLDPAGVSCVGVLLESHISFHTWPDEGVITLDLFTCGSNPLMPVVPVIEELFGVPRVNMTDPDVPADEKVRTMWSHELRGFRSAEARKAHYLDLSSDLSWWVTSPLEVLSKKEIVSVQSDYQRIDIWDVIDVGDTPSYEDMIKHDLKEGDPRFFTSELASPDRLLFLDGKLQSMKETDHEYHESLVHPAMFAHPNPTHVAIIGGGEGATLREVLKHKTVETVKMIEIDPMVISVAREHLPFFNKCADLVNSVECCFDDPRADIEYTDGKAWFIEKYGDRSPADVSPREKFQVVILDALNPEDDSPNSNRLFTSPDFLTAVLNSLTDDGVIVIQAGTAPTIHDPAPDKGVYAQRERLFLMLEDHPDTKVMLVYEESHCGFNEPHSFLVICKSPSCRKQWYAGADAIDFQIYERITTTHSKERALQHFDGATQYSFQFPPKAWETVYCRREPQPDECRYRGLDVNAELRELRDDDEESDFYVQKLDNGEVGVFANTKINEGDYVMAEALASSFVISEESKKNLVETTKITGTGSTVVLDDFLAFIDKHGHESMSEGIGQTIVEVGGSFLMRSVESEEDANVGRWVPKPEVLPTYSPVYERNRRSFDVFLVATKDIEEDEELLKFNGIWD